jgi:hypothetical protein
MTRIWRMLSSKPVNQVGITGQPVAETVSTLEKTFSTLENSVSTLDFSNVLTVFFFCGSRFSLGCGANAGASSVQVC